MTDSDKPAFAVLITKLAKATREELDKNDMAVYFEALQPFSLEAFAYGVSQAIGKEPRFPSVAKLKEHVKAAPRPRPVPVPLIDVMPAERQRECLREVSAILNGKFGTNLKLGEEKP